MIFSVTSSMFFKKLNEYYAVEQYPAIFHDEYIIDTQFWLPGTKPLPHYMYLISQSDLERHISIFHNNLLICISVFNAKYFLAGSTSGCVDCTQKRWKLSDR